MVDGHDKPADREPRHATLRHVGGARHCRVLDAATADDELFVYQFALRMLGAQQAWRWIRQIRASDILTAIIDSGVDLAALRRADDLPGTAWNTQLLPIRICSDGETTTERAAVEAVRYAVARGARVIHFNYASQEPTEALRRALLELPGNFLFVVAAGNDGMPSGTRIYPASYGIPRMIVVTSHDGQGRPDGAIGAGARIDIAAPGDAVYPIPCDPSASGKCFEIDGANTSNAAACVSGAAALLWSAHPYWSAASVKRRILASADPEPKLAAVMQQPRRLNLARMMEPD